jgi:hypothetical protein
MKLLNNVLIKTVWKKLLKPILGKRTSFWVYLCENVVIFFMITKPRSLK